MPPFVEDVKTCFRNHNRFAEVLGQIAHGRTDCGRPLAAEIARQMARDVLVECDINAWSPKGAPLLSDGLITRDEAQAIWRDSKKEPAK